MLHVTGMCGKLPLFDWYSSCAKISDTFFNGLDLLFKIYSQKRFLTSIHLNNNPADACSIA